MENWRVWYTTRYQGPLHFVDVQASNRQEAIDAARERMHANRIAVANVHIKIVHPYPLFY